ncbi:MAG: glycosyltransferase family 4 protein [Kiritimatiellae bacterium]|nr:glycosyltransferase family 4 protein [Kiritimatiellia bacterium]
MQVNIDYQPAVAQRAGIGRYTRLLARHLPASLAEGDRLRLFYFDFTRRAEAPETAGARCAVSARPWRLLPGAVVQQLWKRGLPPRFDLIAGRADVHHFCNFVIPPISPKARTVVTICDMSFMRHPECAEAGNLAYLRARIGATIERADAIITISKFSAREIIEFFPAAKGKVFPIYLGVDQTLASPGREKIVEVKGRLGLERPYILSVGTIEPRKNFSFLVDVFDNMKNPDVELVVVGRPGWNYEPILEKFRTARKAPRIRHLNAIGDGDLAAIYAGAEIYATPSLYEGFGFTPLEAMLCGTPVVSSSGGSLGEVLSDAAIVLHKFDMDMWTRTLDGLLLDRRVRGDLRRMGFAQARKFRWEETARQTAELYRKVAAGAAAGEGM